MAETAPDVFTNHLSKFAEQVAHGVLVDLAPLIARDRVDGGIYEPGLLANWQRGGQTYALPADWDSIAPAVNLDMARRAGVSVAQLQQLNWRPQGGGSFGRVAALLTHDRAGRNALDAGFGKTQVQVHGHQTPGAGGMLGQQAAASALREANAKANQLLRPQQPAQCPAKCRRMETHLLDWANALLRLLHTITAIAWIGSSFYFVWLDNHLIKPRSPDLLEKGVDGALWAVHGGGFYNPQKYMLAPKKIHTELHWFYWESYSTWMTGFALFVVMYLFNPSTYLIDRNVYDWQPAGAVAAALGLLVAFWLVYDVICRTLGERENGDLIVGALVTVFVVAAAYLACQLFAGRAAFLMIGAMLATAMSANVFFLIIPGQRKVVAQMKAGLPVAAIHGRRAKQRSVHNTYFTVPVLVAMLSNHYGWLYQGRHNWLVLVALMLAGALIRHFFVARHKAHVKGVAPPWGYVAAGAALLVVLALALAPAAPPPAVAAAGGGGLDQVNTIVQQRCAMCHNAALQQKGVALHTPELLRQHAQAVYQQTVVTRLMPQNNATQITEAERAAVKRWFEAGAQAD